MNVTSRCLLIPFATIACLAIASTGMAQLPEDETLEQTNEPASVSPASGASLPQLTFIDRRMVTFLAIDTQAGIELAEWARENAQDDRVRQFAGRLCDECTSLLHSLDERTGGLATAKLREDDEDSGDTKLVRPGKRSIRGMLNMERTLMRMKLEIAADSAMLLTSQFESRPQTDIDRCYIGSEVFRQVQALSTLKVLRNYGSEALEPMLDEAIALGERQLAETLAVQASLATPPTAALAVPVAGAN